jgi:hypothetical protein
VGARDHGVACGGYYTKEINKWWDGYNA